MAEPAGQWSLRRRISTVVVLVGIVVVITSVSVYMVADVDVDLRWTVGSVVRTVLSGIMVMISGICVNFLPRAVMMVWSHPENLPRIGDLSWLIRLLRRPLRLLVIVFTAAVIVAAGVVAMPQSTGLERGEIVVMTAFGEGPGDPRNVLFRQWSQSHPDNPVKVVAVPGEPDEQNERMVNDAKPGGAHEADIYVLDLVWMAQFVDNKYIRELDWENLSEADRFDFMPSVLETCRRNGKLWALPFNTDAGLVFYRDDIPGLAAPKTWDDYFGQAAKATAVTAKAGPYGVKAANAAQLADEEIFTITAMEAIWAAGGELVTESGDLVLNKDRTEAYLSPEDLKGIENLAIASKDPDVVLSENNAAVKSTESGAIASFLAGATLFMRNWPVASEGLRTGVEYKVAAPPTPSVLGGQNLALSTTSTKPRAARALAEFLTSRSSQLILSDMGSLAPTRLSTYPESGRTDAQDLRTAVERARPRGITPHYPHFSRVFRTGIARALNNDGKVEPSFARDLYEAWNGR